jgi:adenylate cyclase
LPRESDYTNPVIIMNKRVVTFFRDQILPAVICGSLAFLIGKTAWGTHLKTSAMDQLTQFRARFQPPADERLVVAGIDDYGIDLFGRWPWPRQVHGQFMSALSYGKPATVAWDILFTEPSDLDNFMVDGARALKGRAVFGAYAYGDDEDPQQPAPARDLTTELTQIEGDATRIPSSRYALRPVAALRENGLTAFCDTPGERRLVPLMQRIDGKVFPSLSLQSLIVYWQLKPENIRVVLGDAIYFESDTVQRRIPIDEQGRYFVNYRFGAEGANMLSYGGLFIGYTDHFMLKKPDAEVPPSVENKIVLVGQFATGLTDNGATPFGAETPLVLVHANIIENVLREDYATNKGMWQIRIAMVLLGIIGLIVMEKRKFVYQVLFALAVPAVYLSIATVLWIKLSIAMPLVFPLIGFVGVQVYMICRQLLREQKAKQQIKGMFGTYVSPDLVNRMIDSGQSPELGGHEENITAYFSDIQAFSSFSEKLQPDKLVVLMNEYLSVCTDIIQEEGGTLDKYIGDAVVAMFGAPLPLPDHAFRACVASQRIHLKLLELRAKWKSEEGEWPTIVHEMQSRIGMNSGPVIVGNMGSRTRFNYTMMGDNVNLAARMESGAKSWGAYTMCAEATKVACERDGGDRVVFRALGRIVVKGRSTAVPIYEIVGLKENVSEQTRECVRIFEEGLARYYARDWEAALACFEKSKDLEPNQPGVTPGVSSNPSKVYINIVKRYQIAPPPEPWEGEYVMTEK